MSDKDFHHKNDEGKQIDILRAAISKGGSYFWTEWIKLPFEDEKSILLALASKFNSLDELTELLCAWLQEGHIDAVRALMEAVEHIPSTDAKSVMNYLAFVESLPMEYQYSGAAKLSGAFCAEPDLARACGLIFSVQSPINELMIIAWATAFGGALPSQAIDMATTISGVNSNIISCLLLHASTQSFPANQKAILESEKNILQRLIEASSSPTWRQQAWEVIVRIAEFSQKAEELLLHEMEIGDSPAIPALLSSITRGVWPFRTQPWTMKAVIERLFQNEITEPALLRQIDTAIVTCLSRSKMQSEALNLLIELGANRKINPVLMLERVFSQIKSKKDLCGKLLTAWLVRTDIPHVTLREMLTRCVIGRNPSLDLFTLENVDDRQRYNVARKLLGLLHDGQSVCEFVVTFAEEPSMQPEGINIAGQMLYEIEKEYPTAVENFLCERCIVHSKKTVIGEFYASIYKYCLERRKAIENLPVLDELRPTSLQTQILRAVRQQENREIIRGAEVRSIFSSISTNVNIAQGRRVATWIGLDARPQVFELNQYSHRVDLPSSELCDPIGGILRRAEILRGIE
ncbi:hypothetical protein [Undibacterium umbellatum]|uniref:Uncharacterized protein n=1 Tax=Undibacterium umbellatum TaxID=2762300 RepID=A0ABR6ZHH4_9BURK|nr:hypothetical protein [Undibacterium umbellatum]MBC3911021.1 hypothetical protein [Undibacterium umbellatum]